MKGLTRQEIERQDYVDNVIHDMICKLDISGWASVTWDIEIISAIRSIVCDYLIANVGTYTEREFYPYLGEKSNDTTRS